MSIVVLQATVNTWRLGWNFTAGETVQGGNIYTAGVDVLKLNGSSVQLESLSPNNTVKPFSWTSVSFLGTKAAMPTLPAPYRVMIRNSAPVNPETQGAVSLQRMQRTVQGKTIQGNFRFMHQKGSNAVHRWRPLMMWRSTILCARNFPCSRKAAPLHLHPLLRQSRWHRRGRT